MIDCLIWPMGQELRSRICNVLGAKGLCYQCYLRHQSAPLRSSPKSNTIFRVRQTRLPKPLDGLSDLPIEAYADTPHEALNVDGSTFKRMFTKCELNVPKTGKPHLFVTLDGNHSNSITKVKGELAKHNKTFPRIIEASTR